MFPCSDHAVGYVRKMQPRFLSDGTVADVVPHGTVYRVRIWTPPTGRDSSWFVDEWKVDDAADVQEVIGWAETQVAPGGQVEVFVEFEDARTRADGTAAVRIRHIRVFGTAIDDVSATETVTFTPRS